MWLRPSFMFAGAFILLAALYASYFNMIVTLDVDAAEGRFEILLASGKNKSAAVYGERVLKMRRTAGLDEESLTPLKADMARANLGSGKWARGASLYEQVLASRWVEGLSPRERGDIEDQLARAHISSGALENGVAIYSEFLELAGDEASRPDPEKAESIEAFYAVRIQAAADLFAGALKPKGNRKYFKGSKELRLAASRHMADLGAFYAMRGGGLYASAGLLSSSFDIRNELLGGDHRDTVQVALILGPVYKEMGRLRDAEELYLNAFHAQEKAKGANSPDLSLYIKLLAGVYELQGRQTEAQALQEHMRSLFRDAFGARRYQSNQQRNRKLDIDRPVSQYFILAADYAPTDLVAASRYSVPLSKNHQSDEMKIRLAADPDGDPAKANLPARLAQLMSLCRSDSGERLSLRSGYRAYRTQANLFSRNGARGTVTPPGMSEHQLGLAADIDVEGRFMRRSDRAYQCFEENGFRYGFILSYPPGNNYLPGEDSFEPWHWRYVGIRTAQLYRETGPLDKPQEFLAALPCYQERAISGGYAPIGETDICLEEPKIVAATATADDKIQPQRDNPKTARKLNNFGEGGRSN